MSKVTIVKEKNIIFIGEMSKNLPALTDEITITRISSYAYCNYKGIALYEHSIHKDKQIAIDTAQGYHDGHGSSPFEDGIIPFCIVLYVRGKGWMVFTSNTSINAKIVSENLQVKKGMV